MPSHTYFSLLALVCDLVLIMSKWRLSITPATTRASCFYGMINRYNSCSCCLQKLKKNNCDTIMGRIKDFLQISQTPHLFNSFTVIKIISSVDLSSFNFSTSLGHFAAGSWKQHKRISMGYCKKYFKVWRSCLISANFSW